MACVNSKGYLTRKTRSGKRPNASASTRNWWLVKYNGSIHTKTGQIKLGDLTLPPQYVGKRVRFKIEVIQDQTNKP